MVLLKNAGLRRVAARYNAVGSKFPSIAQTMKTGDEVSRSPYLIEKRRLMLKMASSVNRRPAIWSESDFKIGNRFYTPA